MHPQSSGKLLCSIDGLFEVFCLNVPRPVDQQKFTFAHGLTAQFGGHVLRQPPASAPRLRLCVDLADVLDGA
ncbi:hypothetical protein JY96_12055 [Aquabacterium sp. NJ1]|nr:hypothetical protein JY96_12055 [Aquabacterium sp. NJ1]